MSRPTYWLTRFVILRLLGAIYAVAFLVAINQIIPLIGANGLLPVNIFLQRVGDMLGSRGAGFTRLPSIFWYFHSDNSLLIFAWIGFGLSLVVVAGYANALLLAVLWFLYMSFVHVGQDWYGYGWEIQLLETGFLAIFLCPLLDMRPFPKRETPMPIIILFRWLIFRIMFGAGMIKIRGDEVWRNGTALYYHFETQPLAGPLSRWFHFLPRFILKLGVWYNFLAELVAPWFIFYPRIARHIAGCVIVFLQIILLFSGNLSFLNWLTIVPALACFDDGFWAKILPRKLVKKAEAAAANAEHSKPMITTAWIDHGGDCFTQHTTCLKYGFAATDHEYFLRSHRSREHVRCFWIRGTGRIEYCISKERTMKYRMKKRTGNPICIKVCLLNSTERPPQVAPYQLRLDWQMWFAAMSTPEEYPWTVNLISKLLHNDPGAVGLVR